MRVRAEIELSNLMDEELAKPRRVCLIAFVDTGVTTLSVPEDEIKKLGLTVIRLTITKGADGRREIRSIYGGAKLKILNRACSIDVLASHAGQPALLGQIPLAGLDLVIDHQRQLLTTNPESPDMPMVEVY